MSLDDLGNIGEFIGAAAVVVSLLYLGVQIRQNTRSLRAAAHQSITVHIAELNRTIVEHADVARIMERGLKDLSALSPEEQRRFHNYNSARFRHYDNLFYQYRAGMLEKSQWTGFHNLLAFHLMHPGIAAWWKDNTPYYSSEFVAHVHTLQDDIEKAWGSDESEGDDARLKNNDLW